MMVILGSFHHCTLLVSANLTTLSGMLRGDSSLQGTATDSLRSPTTTLNSASRDVITPRDVTETVAEAYLRIHYNRGLEDRTLTADTWTRTQDQHGDNLVLVVDEVPDELIDKSHETDDWIYCRSPKFTKTLVSDCGNVISISVVKGRVQSVDGLSQSLESWVGRLYQPEAILREVNLLQGRGI